MPIILALSGPAGSITTAALSPSIPWTGPGRTSGSIVVAGDGSWSFSGLTAGTYVLTPTSSNYTFLPQTFIVGPSVTGIMFVGQAKLAGGVTYHPADVVEYLGSTWICTVPTSIDPIDAPTCWAQISQGDGVAVPQFANYTALATDCGKLLAFNTAAAMTLTLPAIPPLQAWTISVQNVGIGVLTVSGNGLNIDGSSSSVLLTPNEGLTIFTDGVNYFTFRGMFLAGVTPVTTGAYTVLPSDNGKLIAIKTTTAIIKLPATAPSANWWVALQGTGVPYTVEPNGPNLDGVSSNLSIVAGQGLFIFSDGTNYFTCQGISPLVGGVLVKTANYIANVLDSGQLISFNKATAVKYDLYDVAAGMPAYWFVFVQNIGLGILEIEANGTVPIDGSTANIFLTKGEGFGIWTDGAGNFYTSRGATIVGGVNSQAVSYAVLPSDNGKMIVLTKATANTLTLPSAPPSTNWTLQVQNIGAGTVTVSPNGLNINGAGTSLTLLTGQGMAIYTDGTNYFAGMGVGSSGSGGGGVNPQTAATYTVLSSDLGKLITFSYATAVAVTLPVASATGFGTTWYTDVQNIGAVGAGLVTITPTTSTIDGAATLLVQPGSGCRIFSDGTNYFTNRGVAALTLDDMNDTTLPRTAQYFRPAQYTTDVCIDNASFLASPYMTSNTVSAPPGWYNAYPASTTLTYNTATQYTSSQCLTITVNSGATGNCAQCRVITLVPGETYEVSGWVKSDGVHAAGFQLVMADWPITLSTAATATTTNNTWTYVTATGTVPTTVGTTGQVLGIFCCIISSVGTWPTAASFQFARMHRIFGGSGSYSSPGMVPDPGPTPGTPLRYVREDATWVSPAGGVNSQTISYTAVVGDSGQLITMNGSSLTLKMPATPPSASWWCAVQNTNATSLTVSPNGLDFDGSAASVVLGQNAGMLIYTDGTNYFTSRGAAGGAGPQSFVPVFTNLTNVGGAPAYTAWYVQVGQLVHFSILITPTTSTASTLNSTYFTCATLPALATMANGGSGTLTATDWNVQNLGTGLIDTNGKFYTPTWSSATYVVISGSYITSAPGASGSGGGTGGGGVNPQTGTTYTVLSSDLGKLITFSNASTVAVTLPVATAAGFGSVWYTDVQNIGALNAGWVTITPTTSTIDGLATLVVQPGSGCRIFSDGTNYWTDRGDAGLQLDNLTDMYASGVYPRSAAFLRQAEFSSECEIDNCDFQAATYMINGAPPGFFAYPSLTACSYNTATPYAGTQSLTITGATNYVFGNRIIAVNVGETYQISGWVKTDGTCTAVIEFLGVTATFTTGVAVCSATSTANVWTYITGVGAVAAGKVCGEIGLGVSGGTGTSACSFDNIRLTRIFGASGTYHAPGLVPDPGSSAGSTHFLREDQTWAIPAGGGGGGIPLPNTARSWYWQAGGATSTASISYVSGGLYLSIVGGNTSIINKYFGYAFGSYGGSANAVSSFLSPAQFYVGHGLLMQTYMGWYNPGPSTAAVNWLGFTDQTAATMCASGNPAGNYAMFRFVNGTDTNFQCVTKDGTTQTVTDSGVAPTAGMWALSGAGFQFAIVSNDATPNVQFYINGVLVATNTTHLPTLGTAVQFMNANRSTAQAAGVTVSYVYIQATI